jgi:plastocyanin
MRRFPHLVALGVLLACLTLSTTAYAAKKKPSAPPAQTYTVMVGAESPHRGVGFNAYFPQSVTIHVGDTVQWQQNANEIHTVTFLAGTTPAELIIPAADAGFPSTPSPLLFNPVAVNPAVPADGLYDGTTYANSGLMGREEGQVQEFSLTFTSAGTYDYMCLVHGVMMSGQVVVVAPEVSIPSPNQEMAEGKKQIAEKLSQVPAVLRAAEAQIQQPVKNPDGTVTHHVAIGYTEGQIALMRFFPDKLNVRAGDTVIWEMSPHNDMPHTVTFLNDEPEPSLVIPVPQPSGPPLLYANPAAFFPSAPAPVLTREGIYNSGVMQPVPGTTYTLTIGKTTPGPEPYICLLHDTSGMRGTLTILPR